MWISKFLIIYEVLRNQLSWSSYAVCKQFGFEDVEDCATYYSGFIRSGLKKAIVIFLFRFNEDKRWNNLYFFIYHTSEHPKFW